MGAWTAFARSWILTSRDIRSCFGPAKSGPTSGTVSVRGRQSKGAQVLIRGPRVRLGRFFLK